MTMEQEGSCAKVEDAIGEVSLPTEQELMKKLEKHMGRKNENEGGEREEKLGKSSWLRSIKTSKE